MKNTHLNYFDKARTWSDDIYAQAMTWRNWSLIIAIISLTIALLAVMALINIFPLKENTPYLVFVDHKDGQPVTIKPVTADEFVESEHLKKYMIRKFVIARERYHPSTLAEDAQIVSSLSSDVVYRDYQSYLAQFDSKDNTLDVQKINISFLNPQRAYVSFIIQVYEQGIMREVPASAQIKFSFPDKEMPIDEIYQINPVNFEVESYQSHYQVNQEVVL
ncbi:MAG: type IV secretion system protein [Legionellales bacterium]|jgi:type IV secretory pathway component VirB8